MIINERIKVKWLLQDADAKSVSYLMLAFAGGFW